MMRFVKVLEKSLLLGCMALTCYFVKELTPVVAMHQVVEIPSASAATSNFAATLVLTEKSPAARGELFVEPLPQLAARIKKATVAKEESKRPTITGPDTLQLDYGAAFPLGEYIGTSVTGEKLACTLTKEFVNKQLGTQEYLLQVKDNKNQTIRYKAVTVEIRDTTPPSLTVPEKLTTDYGKKIDLLANVSANDLEMGDLSAKVICKTTPDFTQVGQQQITYAVEDDAGHYVEQSITLTVQSAVTQQKVDKEAVPQIPATTATAEEKTNAQQATSNPYAPNHIYVGGETIAYLDGGVSRGMAIIDGNPNSLVSTYYGHSFSGTDGTYSHFIGHNPGVFAVVQNVGIGSPVIVTDSAGTAFTYHVYQVYDLKMTAGADGLMYADTAEGQNLVSDLAYQGLTGEKVVLQTCLTNGTGDIRLVYCS